MRQATVTRKTKETAITVSVDLDGGSVQVKTGIGFFDHMLEAFAVHAGIGMQVTVEGDLHVDGHHTVEDTGIVLGQALKEALGDKSGITRFGSFYVPMDESLAFAALDISGRPYLVFDARFPEATVGEYDSCLTVEFFRALAFNAGWTLHLRVLYGQNTHHMIEALFKAAA
ncbi:MAG: imidazoleglycerol-phosphate dehydratase HisB, partial [Clostridia bacterium]|nr:imidazoleglycerol-phosphate dehydratase HisB [Clostridia bacterium]